LTCGTTHVAVGFVDLSLLLNCHLENTKSGCPLAFFGYECSAFSIAKCLVIWNLLQTGDLSEGAAQVVQVWYSAVWTKRTTNAFLAAAKSVLLSDKHSVPLQPAVARIICHWAQSKGVGLQRTMKPRKNTKKESSHARLFQKKCDRVQMLRYYLTGEFGLFDGSPCSGSIVMWDCPDHTPPLQRGECVFNTMPVRDVLESEAWDGNYFQTAEKEKLARVIKLMQNIRDGKVTISFHLAKVCPGPVAKEIASLSPHSISWSNVLDYYCPDDFHHLAKACTSKNGRVKATHFGYSMNWQFVTFGSSILDFKRPPREMLKIIDESNNILQRTLTTGRNRQGVFSFPFRKNPENTTAYALALKTYKPWVQYFFRDSHSDEHASYLEGPSPLAASVAPIALVWTYIN